MRRCKNIVLASNIVITGTIFHKLEKLTEQERVIVLVHINNVEDPTEIARLTKRDVITVGAFFEIKKFQNVTMFFIILAKPKCFKTRYLPHKPKIVRSEIEHQELE